MDLVDQLSAYNPKPDQRYFTTRFVDGLSDSIRSIILVQRPYNLDTACTLALLQEEAHEPRRKEFWKSDAPSYTKPSPFRSALPLPHPPL